MEILKMSLSTSVFILAIVIIRALALHRLPKRTFLALWAVALCRLLIPFSVPSRFSIYTLANMLETHFSAVNATVTGMAPINIGTTAGTTNTSLAEAASVSISPFMVVWLIGLSACALFFLIMHLWWRREYKTALPVDNKFVRVWQQDHPTRRKVEIRQSDRIATPLTYGIFRPVILLPKATDWTQETRLRYILTHEFVHIRRFDTLMKLLLVAAVCVHWFNPLVWVMYVLANRDIELSCDEAVVRTFGETMKSAYALTLIGLEEKKSRITPLVNNFSKNAIEERIVSIMKMKKVSLPVIVVSVVLVAGVTIGFATSNASAVDIQSPTDITGNYGKTIEQSANNDLTKAFDFDASNFVFIPSTYFTFKNMTKTTLHFTSNQIQCFAYIFGDHFIATKVGDTLPSGIYVNDDGTEAYVFDKKADGSLIMTKYKVDNNSYKIVAKKALENVDSDSTPENIPFNDEETTISTVASFAVSSSDAVAETTAGISLLSMK
jgi:beta-lactamase regulating signal transducer with metallopeptidase domain